MDSTAVNAGTGTASANVHVDDCTFAGAGNAEGFLYQEGVTTFQPPPAWRAAATACPAEVLEAIRTNRVLPTEERLIVWAVEEDKTKGGIIIPDSVKRKNRSLRCWIVALGPDAKAQGWEVGQCVLVSQYAGVMLSDREVGTAGKPLDFITAKDILGADYREVTT